MKLRNKKTGMIGEAGYVSTTDGTIIVNNINDQDEWYDYNSLAELNEEWEDYEEPSKTIWQIKDSGELQDFKEDDFSDGYIESSKSIGNYFETREEAEKAVEKLKAWKRLKDKGVTFDNSLTMFDLNGCIGIRVYIPKGVLATDDFEIILGGEE